MGWVTVALLLGTITVHIWQIMVFICLVIIFIEKNFPRKEHPEYVTNRQCSNYLQLVKLQYFFINSIKVNSTVTFETWSIV